jgi:lysophospholipase L1-like esterase
LSVAAALVPGVAANAELAPSEGDSVGLTVSDLRDRLDAAPALNGFVLVQAGFEDLAGGTLPTTAVSEIQELLQEIVAKGAVPIVALATPSDENGVEVIELNGLLQAAASESGFGVLDLFSPVAAADGSWDAAFSDDGVVPNAAGSDALAQAAIVQLPQLTVSK